MKTIVAMALAAALALPFAGVAQQASDHAAHRSAALANGEVRKVDKDAKKITIRHGPLANLDMPGMTMVFQVKDLAMLDEVKAGDKVKFAAEKVGGAYTVTAIERVR